MSKQKVITIQNRYLLADDQAKRMVIKLRSLRSRRQQLKKFAVFVLDGNSSFSDLGRMVEKEVFLQFFGNDESVFAVEYGPYEKSSKFIVVVDQKKLEPAGVLRIISHNKKGLKTIIDSTISSSPWKLDLKRLTEEHQLDLSKTWDLATIAVRKPYRGKRAKRLVRSALLHELYQQSKSNGINHWIALLDDRHISAYEKIGVRVEAILGATGKPYLGSKSTTPILIDLKNLPMTVKERSRLVHQYFIKGRVLRTLISFPKKVTDSLV